MRFLWLFACSVSLAFAAQPSPRHIPVLPGQKADGTVLLPNQWSLKPAGTQIVMGDFPVNIALHPKQSYAAILHSGNSTHEIFIVNINKAEVVSRVTLEESFYGLEFSKDGNTLFASGAGSEVIHIFSFGEGGYLTKHREVKLRDVKERGVPAGLAVSDDAKKVFVANVWGHQISEIDVETTNPPRDIDLAETDSPRVSPLPKPSANADLAADTKREQAQLETTKSTDPFPYSCRIDSKRNRLYVSQWAQSSVVVVDLQSNRIVGRWATQEHPTEMLLTKSGKYLFVANANRNTVSLLDTANGKPVETISVSLYPIAMPGSTPNSLALSPDDKTLYVANACNNNVAVFDVSNPGSSKSLGFIPVGWYPTSVRITSDGKKLLVANGKGIISKPNRYGPQPGHEAPASVREYIGSLFKGTLSIINLPAGEKFAAQMETWTAQAYACSPLLNDSQVKNPPEKSNPIPSKLGDPSPIKYVLYVIKENRTYDQVLGDLPQGNGDPSLTLFPRKITPNHHKIAEEFVLLDNFYVESEVSADGHEWTMGAYATDFVEKFWPLSYGHNKHGKYPFPAEGNLLIAQPANGYLWDRAKEAGLSFRSYGEFVANGKTAADPSKPRVKTLVGHYDPWFRGFDMDYPDAKRADRFISEVKRFEKEGDMPRLQILRLPNDHTSGTTAGKLTPSALVADNDLALGRVVEALSHSKFWKELAIFIVEDDAQNGPDHVDAHRTIAFVISPYVKRRSVDSTMYSTSSMLRTMELILGLKPMTQFDAAAIPMFNSFHAKRDTRPYSHLVPEVDLTQKNLKTAWGGRMSEKMDFTKEDAADDLKLNEVIWRSVKGPDSPMPAPTRAAFVFVHPKGDDDDDD